MDIKIIVEGFLLSFQCADGLVPDEGTQNATCTPEGRWNPDPTLHRCTNGNNNFKRTCADKHLVCSCAPSGTAPVLERLCVSATLSTVIAVSVTVVALVFNAATFLLGLLVGTHRKNRKEASNTVSAAQSEADTPAISETAAGVELERVHEYEDIVVLRDTHGETRDVDIFTNNAAYGCNNP